MLSMKKIILLASLPFLLQFCATKKKEKENTIDLKEALMEADRDFSKMSETKGMRNAFMEYIDSNGVLLRPNATPLVGANAIDFISQSNDTSFTMTWEPSGGNIAASGELGYTYGVYSIRPKTKDSVRYGTYVSIWKKQPNGKWKFILDTGNEGISPE